MGGVVNSVFGGGKDQGSSDSADAMAQMARQLWTETSGVRAPLIEQMTSAVSGDFDPGTSPIFAPQKRAIESQYGVAKDNLLASMPAGGAMTSAMADLESNRANSLADMMGSIYQDQLNKAYGASFNAPGQAIQGLGSAASIQSANEASQRGMFGDLGMAAGYFLGGK